MLRSNYLRYNRKNRTQNLDNLHVISTETVVSPSSSNLLQICANPQEFYPPTDKKVKKKQRKREIKHLSPVQPIPEQSQYRWFNTEYLNNAANPPEEKVETTECSGVPAEESYFEEVEVASYGTEGAHEIPVGFRKSKIYYLKYKRNCFFKPKIYNFVAERTIVNCLNIQNNSPDIDIVSEAEYEIDCETDKSDKYESHEELHMIAEDDEKCELEKNEKCEPKENEKCEPKEKEKCEPKEKEKCEPKEKEKCEPVEKEKCEPKENDRCEVEVQEKSGDHLRAEKQNDIKSGIIDRSTIIKCDEFDLYQGKSLDQSSLDTWKSHLIGLEYLLEVQNEKKDTVMKYYCVLCSDDLAVQGFPSICVINHINGYKHMVKYLEKHFPACGYKFDENSNHDNVVVLQKLCDVVNRHVGCNFMCITNLDQYMNNKQKIVDIILNAHHFDEGSLKLDDKLLKTVESILLDEASDVLSDIIQQITSDDTVKSETQAVQSIQEKLDKGSNIQVCLESDNEKNKSECRLPQDTSSISSSKPVSKGKRSKSIASYLKLTHARARFTKSHEASKAKPREPSKVLKQDQVKENSESVTSKQKSDANDISECKILKESELGVQETAEEKAEITMTLRDAKTRIGKVSKLPKIIKPNARQKLIYKIREKALQKQTMHSKHCRKRILGKENSRLRMTVKPRENNESVHDVITKSNVQCQSVGLHSTSERIVSEKKRTDKMEELKKLPIKPAGNIIHKLHTPIRKVSTIPISKITKIGPKSTGKISKGHLVKNITVHPQIIHKCSENTKSPTDIQERDLHSHRKITNTSRTSKHSKSPIQRIIRKHSRSPVRRIKSPLRVIRSPIKRHSRSPVRKIKSPLRVVRSSLRKSPVRRYSRSPVRRHSRSPFRRLIRSPVRRHSRSAEKRHSRSPLRKHSRSPIRKHSRSPVRRHSRSPVRRHSRSPVRRHSRSPVRRQSRSPVRRHSRSSVRRYSRNSRSPLRRHSKSPIRFSRSPGYQKSRSPYRKRSKTPVKHYSRSPVRRYSRSPIRRRSRSPVRRFSKSPHRSPIKQSNSYRDYSPVHERSRSFQINSDPHEKFSSPHKHFSTHDLSLSNKGNIISKSDKYKLYSHLPALNRDISDLDPVSDEDESVYFNTSDKRQQTEDSKMMFAQILQKFSLSNANDTTMKKLMQFIESHSDELQDVMSSQRTSDKRGPLKVDANIQDRNVILQQYLLSNLAGNTQQSVTSNVSFLPAPNVPPDFTRPPFIQDRACLPPYGLPPHGTIPDPSQVTHSQSRYFPPNLNVPPPEHFHQFSHISQGLSPKPKDPPENVFKDLRATVDKLFGANESSAKQEKNKPNFPSYVTEPDPDKWDLSHPNAPKFNVPPGSKDIFHSQSKSLSFHNVPGSSSMRSNMPVSYKSNSGTGSMHYFNRSVDRPQPNVLIPPPDTKVAFCDGPSTSSKGNLFPVVNNMQGNPNASTSGNVSDVKVSLAQRLASVLVKVGMIDVPAPLLQEMLMKIGAFSSSPPQDIRETEILSILKRLGYLS